ncbi:TUP1-like enhancer of split-domain-containing protein [Dunaliella salina]|uniref:TUP1-like enhancer of split-domain-containing protein n=1 Tax=Dunaliella salina TaxID=3046 RepID=A0ABQ7GGK1_DUNSA|nr:TUP1-like enhancer of split-domain-containing protein [Dunaliella salina]|eukprot:KAF5833723.1 TUP1-like enhancer of split-domain-containing protein [Dunaliella salina]
MESNGCGPTAVSFAYVCLHSCCRVCYEKSTVIAAAAVLNAGLTQTGIPLLIMQNHHAYSYNEGWACWMRVADDAFPASHFHSSFSSNQGILSSVQAAVAGARQPRDVLAAANQPPHIQNRATRAHLECNVASALVMQSQQEWRRWLQTYVRQLAGDEDEARLKEIINDLLGPMRWSPSSHGAASAHGKGWEPKIFDLDKRQILRYDVLREVSRVRSPSMQSLATQSLEALKEAEATVAASEADRKQREASAAFASAMPVSPASGLGTAELQMGGDGLQGGGFGSQLAL